MQYAIVNKLTGQPLGLVTATDERSLFVGMSNLADEGNLPLQHLAAVPLSDASAVPDRVT